MSDKLSKTLVEKILDKHKVTYQQFSFPVNFEDEVAQLELANIETPKHKIYKTLVLSGKTTGPVVGVIPLDEHLSLKKMSAVSGNKKVAMLPLKELAKTTGYEHGANTPVGIYESHHFPIYISDQAKDEPMILVSSGKIGRSIGINPLELAEFVHGKFADLSE